MKIEAFLTLQAAVERGSFAAAAEAVKLTPSAVSLQIKQLEAYFGQSLFDRSGRAVQATGFARQLIDTMARPLADLEKLRNQRAQPLTGRVRLGVTGSVPDHPAPQGGRRTAATRSGITCNWSGTIRPN